MANSPEQQRREAAQQPTPDRGGGGGQMGAQKSTGGKTGEPKESQSHVSPGRDDKPDMPDDDGGRVSRR